MRLILFLLCSLLFSTPSTAQTFDEIISASEKKEGFFTTYYHQKSDKIYLELSGFNQEFIYVESLSRGLGSNDIGLDRGQIGDTKLVYFERRGPKIFLVQPNQDYRAVSENDLEIRAVKEAFASSVLWSFPVIEGESSLLIDLSPFLLRDAHGVINRLARMKEGQYKLDASRSALEPEWTRNFPDNSEFEVILTFTGEPKGRLLSTVAPSSESFTLGLHHSFVKLPGDGYSPREFDPRAGYFGISFLDYATQIEAPLIKRYICRHRLIKKNPGAALSDPVEPIVYYLDPGTPEPVRSALLDGAKWWSDAFEAAGFSNAFQVKILPADADPMDIRYNLIQWVHRSTRGWSYGVTVTDPRTGEIIKGKVSLGSLRVRQDFLLAEGLLNPYDESPDTAPLSEMALARLRQLSAHEVGHTLGLVHNYTASTNNRSSVMDYPHPYIQLKNGQMDLSEAYDVGIGEWDKISISYGYAEVPDGKDEKSFLNDILEQAHEDGWRFISDRDARDPSGAHPYAHLWDNGTDATEEMLRLLQVRDVALNNLSEQAIRFGEPMSELEERLVPVYLMHRYQLDATSKLIGGIDYYYKIRGDNQPKPKLLDADIQREAVLALMETIKPAVLRIPESILNTIAPKPLGYNRSRESFDSKTSHTFDPFAAAQAAMDLSLQHLFDAKRLNRLLINETAMNSGFSLQEYLDLIVEQTIKSKAPSGSYESRLKMEVDAAVLKHLAALLAQDEIYQGVQTAAYSTLIDIKSWMAKQRTKDSAWAAYYDRYQVWLEEVLEGEIIISDPAEMVRIPDGSPIGQN